MHQRSEISSQACVHWLQVEEERTSQLAKARQQMQQEVAQAVATEAAEAAASQQAAQLASAQQESARAEQAASSQPESAQQSAEQLTQLSAEERSQAAHEQLVREVKGFVKAAKEGIRKRQAALQYARSSWQVKILQICAIHTTSECIQEIMLTNVVS